MKNDKNRNDYWLACYNTYICGRSCPLFYFINYLISLWWEGQGMTLIHLWEEVNKELFLINWQWFICKWLNKGRIIKRSKNCNCLWWWQMDSLNLEKQNLQESQTYLPINWHRLIATNLGILSIKNTKTCKSLMNPFLLALRLILSSVTRSIYRRVTRLKEWLE